MAKRKQFAEHRDSLDTVTILQNTSESSVFDSHGMSLVGVNIPAAFTGTLIFFQSSPTRSGTFQDLYNFDGVRFCAVVGVARNVRWDVIYFKGDRFIKIISDQTETTNRILTLQFTPR